MAKPTKHKKHQPRDPAQGAAAVPADGQSRTWTQRHAPWVALLALALLAYLPALRAGFVWDDHALYQNPLVAAPGGLLNFWLHPALNATEHHYWPLVYSTFWLEYRLWGFHPFGYHLVNVLLHGVCCVLLWRVLRRLGVPGAWLGAALFAVHPVHVESVAWIIERKDILSGALYLGAALSYLRFDEQRSHKPYGSYGTYFLALALFTLAMLSKSIVVTLPVALGIVIWWKRGRLGWRDVAPLIPLALIGIALTLADLVYYKGIVTDMVHLTPGQRIQIAGRALWFYLGKLAWPHPLATLYPKWDASAAHLAGWLPLAGAVAGVAALWLLRKRLGRGPVAGVAFYGLTLAPVLTLVKFEFLQLAWVADRFQYLASIGPLVLAAAAIWKCGMRNVECGNPRFHSAFRNPHSAFAILLLAVCGVLTFRQAALYHDAVTLFRHNVAVYPQNWIAYFYLGTTCEMQGKDEEALAAYGEAQRLKPSGSAVIPRRLARLQARLGRIEEAGRNFQAALRMTPDDAELRNDFGIFMAGLGQIEEAAAQYREAVRLNPRLFEARANLGTMLLSQGDRAGAAEQLSEALRLRPDHAETAQKLAQCRQAQ